MNWRLIVYSSLDWYGWKYWRRWRRHVYSFFFRSGCSGSPSWSVIGEQPTPPPSTQKNKESNRGKRVWGGWAFTPEVARVSRSRDGWQKAPSSERVNVNVKVNSAMRPCGLMRCARPTLARMNFYSALAQISQTRHPWATPIHSRTSLTKKNRPAISSY